MTEGKMRILFWGRVLPQCKKLHMGDAGDRDLKWQADDEAAARERNQDYK